MKKIRNTNVPGECTNGYAGPVESGRGGSRKSPVNFTGTSPPSNRFSFIRKRITAAFFILTALIFSFFPRTGQSNTLGDGKFTFNDIVYAMALPFSVFTSCKPEPEPTGPTTVTKNVTVTFPALGSNPTVINLNPIYTPDGGWGDFNASDIRFTITDNKGNGNDKFPDGNIDINRDASLYGIQWPWPPPLFTHTFYDSDDNVIGKYSFFIGDYGESGYFNRIREDSNKDGTYQSTTDQTITSLPYADTSKSLVLQLSKVVE